MLHFDYKKFSNGIMLNAIRTAREIIFFIVIAIMLLDFRSLIREEGLAWYLLYLAITLTRFHVNTHVGLSYREYYYSYLALEKILMLILQILMYNEMSHVSNVISGLASIYFKNVMFDS
jgi:hypothetical protein